VTNIIQNVRPSLLDSGNNFQILISNFDETRDAAETVGWCEVMETSTTIVHAICMCSHISCQASNRRLVH
jgi:hypothetical protein